MHTPQQQNTHRERESEWMREKRSKAFVMLMQSIFVLCMVIFVCTMHNARIKLNEFLPIFPSNIAFMVVNSVFFTNILFFSFLPSVTIKCCWALCSSGFHCSNGTFSHFMSVCVDLLLRTIPLKQKQNEKKTGWAKCLGKMYLLTLHPSVNGIKLAETKVTKIH